MGKTNIYRLDLNVWKCEANSLFWKDFINVLLAELQTGARSPASPYPGAGHTALPRERRGRLWCGYLAAAHRWHFLSAGLEALPGVITVIVTTGDRG